MIPIGIEEEDRLRESWLRIYSEYGYMDTINRVSSVYPDEKSIYVSFKDLSDFGRHNPSFESAILDNPEHLLALGEEVLRSLIHTDRVNVNRVNLRISGLSEDQSFRKEIRQIRSEDIEKLLSIKSLSVANLTTCLPTKFAIVQRPREAMNVLSDTRALP